MENLLQKIRQFREERNWDQYHSPKNLAMALMVEVGELAEHFQWLTQQQSQELLNAKKEALKDEIGDVLIYLANLADKLGIDPMQAAYEELDKNSKKYPAEKVHGMALKYSEHE